MTFWTELRRRKVLRVGIAYLAGVWLLIQVASVVLPSFDAPRWVMQAVIFSSVGGLPFAVLLAWVYRVTPERTNSAEDARPDEIAIPASRRKVSFIALAALAGALLGSGSVWLLASDSDARWARDVAIPELYRLIDQQENLAAYTLAEEVERRLPDNPLLAQLWPQISRPLSFDTEPAGADVYARPYDSADADYRYLGKTPLKDVRVRQGTLRLRVEKDGYESAVVAVTSSEQFGPQATLELTPSGTLPAGMVHVPATVLAANDVLFGLHSAVAPLVPAFDIDKYEVTNRQFKAFVDAGGYQSRAYWKHPAVTAEGAVLDWQQAMSAFRDETGRPGPSTWRGGSYAPGRDDYPVTGVSWYEAAAFAEFAGRSLPTIHHWVAAASAGLAGSITPLSNFESDTPNPVAANDGMSRFGVFGMAGNAREWVWNEFGASGERYILGGAWNEWSYSFATVEARLPSDRAPENGFRTARYVDSDAVADLWRPIEPAGQRPDERIPASDEAFRLYAEQYDYDPAPLDAETEVIATAEARWRIEKVSFAAAYGNERITAFLFLPTHVDPPFQTLLYFPDGGAPNGGPSASIPVGRYADRFDELLLSGRAVFFPVYYGTFERRDPRLTVTWPTDTPTYREWSIRQIQDAKRALDYLESRADIDKDKLAYTADSWGGERAPPILALDDRFKTAVLVSGGIAGGAFPAVVDPVNFAPRVSVPVLMLNGDQDALLPRKTSQEPLFALLGSAEKRHSVYTGGHGFSADHPKEVTRETLEWLDRYLGPVD